ncbi:DUF3857 domain-containing protein [Flavobacterium turcicum]|uniref:DUF3857 and transglutaminase domain-containing protein n=1 Tax=Flavobacterium turcicum TaxID=2764718 RepID=A0ABR7JGQ8_9FLAO|nr:DUF3857 domain-containing protein [Flavobacterium turcicum]MBC5863683.1 DUF3857 and transglutaminase domain-containing protein [Flavobacterium turcicum]NHL02369.1 DUF3857 and transglutaminase domain-containing protein [Flavobacterium turcicum]
MRQHFTLLVLLLVHFFSFAQDSELGKVSIAELQQKAHPIDSTASAAVLFEKGRNVFEYSQSQGFYMVTEVQVRLKIYKKEGYDWATKIVEYYSSNEVKETVTFSDAITYNMVDGKIEKTKLKSDGEFDEFVNKFWRQKKITMPNVKVGSVIEYSYKIRTPRVGSPRDWYFQKTIPVNYSEYKNSIPEFFVYNENLKGYFQPTVSVTIGRKALTFSGMSNSAGAGFQRGQSASYAVDKVDYEEKRTIYKAENIPALNDEAFVGNIENYTSGLVQELSMTKYPGEPLKKFATDWKAVAKSIFDMEDFGAELNRSGYFEEDLKKALAGIETPEQKIVTIFNFVKGAVKWNGFYGYSCDDGVRQAYKNKTGNIAEINLMLTAMLRFAGFSAHPVLLSTRSNGIALFPNRTAFNYVIAAIEDEKGLILLDATDLNAAPNTLPIRDLNWLGRLLRKDGTSIEVDLMPNQVANDIVTMQFNVEASGQVDAKVRRQQSGHNALVFRTNFLSSKEQDYIENFETEHNNIEVTDYSRTNERNLGAPLTETLSFKSNNLVESIGGKLYVKPLLIFGQSSNPFQQEDRFYPIDFAYPFMNKYSINVKIPAGYKVESVPETSNLAMQDDIGMFKYLASVSGDTIQISISSQINTPIISADYYQTIKEFYQKMIDKQNEKIILVKS